MKKLFFLVISYLLTVICVNAQTTTCCDSVLTVYNGEVKKLRITGWNNYGTIIKNEPHKIIGDTLILSDTSIHFIQIGDQTFEIKRRVTLEPATAPTKPSFFIGGSGSITLLPDQRFVLPAISSENLKQAVQK
jgi:hypothetical protein